MEVVYICSPYKGNIRLNTKRAKQYCLDTVNEGNVPIAPHLLYPRFLNENNDSERTAGLNCALELLKLCDIVYQFGEPSEGMAKELELAKQLGIPIEQKK